MALTGAACFLTAASGTGQSGGSQASFDDVGASAADGTAAASPEAPAAGSRSNVSDGNRDGPEALISGGAMPETTTPGGREAAPDSAKKREKRELPPGLRGVLVRKDKRLPDPSAEQLEALEILEQELKQYEADAKDYQETLTMVVHTHFAERRQRILGSLDDEITVETEALADARDEAIARLEDFVARYSGPNADPQATPDAMFRLAALYEERARADFDADLEKGLRPAIDLYLRIVRQFPGYEQLAGVYYFLGHAYTDAARLDEGQQAWRALVCGNRYHIVDDVNKPHGIRVEALPQDHEPAFWNEWYNKYPIPLDQRPSGLEPLPEGLALEQEELRFVDPYSEGCQPVPQEVPEGEDPKYLAEVWWQVGNFHFDQIDQSGGPYELNRAESAYSHSLEYHKPPLYGVAMYKHAWTLFKQQRYEAATRAFVDLLHYTDREEERTGDPGADFRSEAATYIAGSLTYLDFQGPPPEHPNIARSDVLDVERDPLVAEQKMAIAITRVQDPALIPQDRKWTARIYKALAREYLELTQLNNAITTFQLALDRFPLDRDAPLMQAKVAEVYDQLARLAPEESAAKDEYAAKALQARTGLAAYVGQTAWTEANQEDPEALQTAEKLVKNGLKRAAADHTNFARTYVNRANELSDEDAQRELIQKAIAEYRLAESGWAAYIEHDPTAIDAYESRFWLADARYWTVVLQVALGTSPSAQEVDEALAAAATVRDSNEDDQYLQPAAYYAVSLSEKVLQDLHRLHRESGGFQGIEKREEVTLVGEGTNKRPEQVPMPKPVLDAVEVRDEYNQRVNVHEDPEKNGFLYEFQSADYFFVYGHFDEAQARFEPLYDAFCGKNEWGYKAWEKLISMSNFTGNAKRSRELVEGKSCAYDEETRLAEEAIRTPVRQGVAYLDARELYDEAEAMEEGPERDDKWRQAAAAYKTALDAAPDRDEAPEAAMNGAYAYKQVGEYDKAIAMYSLFIDRYGSEEKLRTLRQGDPNAEPPVEADPAMFEERVKFLNMAYDALAGAYVLFFDYPKAAQTFDRISQVEHFERGARKEAAKQALGLYVNLGDEEGMQSARDRFYRLGATAEERAEADYTVASLALKRWDPYSAGEGANAQARVAAEAAMRRYFDRNKNDPAAAKYVVTAAYWAARAQTAGGGRQADHWWRATVQAYDNYAARAPAEQGGGDGAKGSPEASMAAEAAFRLIDDEVRDKFDYDTGHHRYRGTPVEVIKQYQADAVTAKQYYDRLQAIVDTYAAPEWAAAAVARQGSLYDSLRTGLYDTRPPELEMFDKKTERLLKMAETSDNMDLIDKADQVRLAVEGAWRDKRDQELDSADRIMVDRYATALMLARRYNVSNPTIVRAIGRLAFFTDVIGEAKLAQYTMNVPDLNYSPGMFVRMRPGLVPAPKPDGDAPPAPAPVEEP